ncbi:hypothetical protein [Kribbella sp. CA-293567]|nr:hypothetical protein [Kribbella sp. CA-293567]WBQ04445.1 hypothetical protein OX958_31340 [Kribbella sp. CA-293567]
MKNLSSDPEAVVLGAERRRLMMANLAAVRFFHRESLQEATA